MNKNVVEIKKKADEIKSLYNNYLRFKKQTFSYANLETKDGEAIFVEEGKEIEVGVPCYKMDENGAPVPCEDGTYELTDGRTIEVKEGLISQLMGEVEIEVGDEGEDEEMKKHKMEDGEVKKEDEEMKKRVMAVEQTCEKMMEMLEGLMAKYEEDMKKMGQKMSKLYMSTQDELKRDAGKKVSVVNKTNTKKFMEDLREYANYRDMAKTPTTTENFSAGSDKASAIERMKELMANARTNGSLGSINIKN